MRYTLRLFGRIPLFTLTAEDKTSMVIYQTGGNFEIAPVEVEEEHYEYEEEYTFGFRRPS